MLLPKGFQEEVSKRFYDKQLTILQQQELIEPDGGVTKTDDTVKGTFLGNIRFVSQEAIQNEIGLTIDADIIVTCSINVDIAIDDLVSYLGKKYRVNDLLQSDSHLTITGKECQ